MLIVVDRIDLDTQITGTFTGADIPNLEKAETRDKLQQLLAQDVRKIIITTIFKFGEADGVLNERGNIIALVDEAHRTQEGDLGRKMRDALPNAFLFGLTGTPINRFDRNTFYAFGAEEDDKGYMSRYGFEESIRDGATLKLHFEPRLLELHIDKAAIDAAFKEMTGGLPTWTRTISARPPPRWRCWSRPRSASGASAKTSSSTSRARSSRTASRARSSPSTANPACSTKTNWTSSAAGSSEIVMTVNANEPQYKPFDRSRDEEERLLDRFRDPERSAEAADRHLQAADRLRCADPAGDVSRQAAARPHAVAGYLPGEPDLLRTEDPRPDRRLPRHLRRRGQGAGVRRQEHDGGGSNIQELKDSLPEAMQKCLAFFAGVDRTVEGYEGLIAAQQCLPNNTVRDNFAAEYSLLGRLWEAISPDPILGQYEKDYSWLSQVYQSVQPSSGHGKLIWHSLGAKTIELIHQNVHVDAVRDDLDTLVLDADLLEAVLSNPDPKKAKEIEIKVARRLRKHLGNPKFKALSERLDALRDRFESGVLNSVEFLKQLLQIAKEVLQAEKETPPEEDEDRGKAALTELFNEVKTPTRRSLSNAWWPTSTRSFALCASPVGRTRWPASGKSRRRCAKPFQVQAACRRGTVREGLQLHSAVLLTAGGAPEREPVRRRLGRDRRPT